MNMLITGGTGFIGSELTNFFLQQEHNITVLSRNTLNLPNVRIIKSIKQINSDEKIDVIINLAGAPINKRWSSSYKKLLINSRLEVTKNLILLIRSLKTKPNLFISASAIGYYGAQNNKYIDENSSYINDFIHELCDLWELEAGKAEKLGVRTCITRLGVVLGKNGGALKEMLPIFKLGLGGKIGSGKQFFSWIHLSDVISAFNFLINDKKQKGIFNITSPDPVTNYKFTKTLGKILNRPTIFAVPAFAIKIMFGEMGEKLLSNGVAVYPKKLLDNGYKFQFKMLESALDDILK
jgi:uncharacterized protein (TIGR01777 family)